MLFPERTERTDLGDCWSKMVKTWIPVFQCQCSLPSKATTSIYNPWRIHSAGIYMLTWLGYIDGKCYHIYIAYMDPMGNGWQWNRNHPWEIRRVRSQNTFFYICVLNLDILLPVPTPKRKILIVIGRHRPKCGWQKCFKHVQTHAPSKQKWNLDLRTRAPQTIKHNKTYVYNNII